MEKRGNVKNVIPKHEKTTHTKGFFKQCIGGAKKRPESYRRVTLFPVVKLFPPRDVITVGSSTGQKRFRP
jgi:hypothetical protein